MTSQNTSHDWRRLAREKLGFPDLEATERDEIVTELAGHLEDQYEHVCSEGLAESGSIARVLGDVDDWDELARNIWRARQKEGDMNQRTKSIWIPGLVSLTAASAVLALLQRTGVEPHIIWLRSGLAFMLYIPWLVTLPFFGALGAYSSRRAGGRVAERLAAGLFPSVGVLGFLFVAMLAAPFMERQLDVHFLVIGIAVYISNWVGLPALALLLGVAPFLPDAKLRPLP
jgi:hypothetical protein